MISHTVSDCFLVCLVQIESTHRPNQHSPGRSSAAPSSRPITAALDYHHTNSGSNHDNDSQNKTNNYPILVLCDPRSVRLGVHNSWASWIGNVRPYDGARGAVGRIVVAVGLVLHYCVDGLRQAVVVNYQLRRRIAAKLGEPLLRSITLFVVRVRGRSLGLVEASVSSPLAIALTNFHP